MMTPDDHPDHSSRPSGLFDAVDRWGSSLARWRDPDLARRGREALLSNRGFRAYRDEAVAVERRLNAAGRSLDEDIHMAGANERVLKALRAAIGPTRRQRRQRLAALAAAFLLCAVLGSVVESLQSDANAQGRIEVVQLDTFVFGPTEADLQ